MNFFHSKQVWVVYRKELRDTLRDRRTLFSMLLFPALIIPGLMIGFSAFAFKVVNQAHAETASIMVIGPAGVGADLRTAIGADSKLKVIPATPDYAEKISSKTVRAAIEIPPDFDQNVLNGTPSSLKIFNYEGELKSGFAVGELEHVVDVYRDRLVEQRLVEHRLTGTFIRPFDVQRQNVAPPEKVGGNMIGGLIPYLLILISFIGAMYPAIELTTGEKERGTMETILCSPVGRMELVLGKFLTVLTISLTTVAVGLIGFLVGGVVLAQVIMPKLFAAAAAARAMPSLPMLNPLGLIAVVIMIVPLAVFFSAVVFTIALLAKSHKEAQTYISPFVGIIVLPAIASMLPGLELNAKLALVPILNISLVSKEMVSGSFPWGLIALIFFSSCGYAAVALGLAVKMFQRESVIFRT